MAGGVATTLPSENKAAPGAVEDEGDGGTSRSVASVGAVAVDRCVPAAGGHEWIDMITGLLWDCDVTT